MTKAIAIRAGALRYDFAREGRALQFADALTAATPLVLGAALVTANIADFAVAGLTRTRLAEEH